MKEYYYVRHKNMMKSEGASVVLAESPEEATKLFNDPEDVGKTAQVREVRKTKKIPKNWNVAIMNKNGFLSSFRTYKDIPLDNPELVVQLTVREKQKIDVKVKDIISASKPSKDKNVMRSYIR